MRAASGWAGIHDRRETLRAARQVHRRMAAAIQDRAALRHCLGICLPRKQKRGYYSRDSAHQNAKVHLRLLFGLG